MVTKIKQGDLRWANVLLGPSNATVRDYGCTTSSLCMAIEKLRGYFCSPADAARYWAYTKQGLIIWGATEFKGMKFVKRGYTGNIEEVKKYANAKDKAAIIEVNNGKHWVYVDNISANGDIAIIDPIDGNYYDYLPSKYKFTGYAIFEKVELVSDWAQESWTKATKKGIVDGTRPQESVTREELMVILDRLKLI